MRAKLVPMVVLPLLILSGCYVQLPISEAIAEPIPENEVAPLKEHGARPSTPGEWLLVRVGLAREAVQKIARWQLYTHVRVEDCRTGGLIGIASSVGIEDTEGDFNRIQDQLRSDERRQAFVIAEPIFFPADKPLDQPCVRLEGGSYTLQKISSDPVPLQLLRNRG